MATLFAPLPEFGQPSAASERFAAHRASDPSPSQATDRAIHRASGQPTGLESTSRRF
jgi:hypothetical protein